MDNNSFLAQPKLSFKNIKLKNVEIKNKFGGLVNNNIYPYIHLDKNERSKSQINSKIYKTSINTRKNSLNNSKNNSNCSSANNSKYKFNNSFHFISNSIKKQNKIKKNLIKNHTNFDLDNIVIKSQEDWGLPLSLSKKFKKSTPKSNYNMEKGKYIKTENNQKLIFNNVGIHYHRAKNNHKIEFDKKESNNEQEISKLKNQIYILLKKNTILETEKAEKDSKIEDLEQKLEKLINFIKDKNFSEEDNEKVKLKNKISSLENSVDFLKNENSELKNEIAKMNKIILLLKSNQIEIKKNKSIGKKKQKSELTQLDVKNRINTLNNLDEKDIKKIKLISIDPDNF